MLRSAANGKKTSAASDIAGSGLRGKAFTMFSDLALIDWIALVFAAVLLAAAAAAGVVAYATAKNRPLKSTASSDGHRPAHAAETPPPPTGRAVEVESSFRQPAHDRAHVPASALVGSRAPLAESAHVMTGSTVTGELESASVATDGVLVEPSPEESVAARAAKLRRRPVPDNETVHKRIVSAVEPQRTPANAPNRAFEPAPSNQLTIDKEPTQGFAARTPGFFEDPVGRHELRYWDGHRWTEYVKEHGERFTDPL